VWQRLDLRARYDSEFGPLFFAEVEHGNRSLPELIRHLGMFLANFPNLNGVLGIKGEEDADGNKVYALILIEWRTDTQILDGTAAPLPEWTRFGNEQDTQRSPVIIGISSTQLLGGWGALYRR
jgi:hypothetical protein